MDIKKKLRMWSSFIIVCISIPIILYIGKTRVFWHIATASICFLVILILIEFWTIDERLEDTDEDAWNNGGR